MASLFALILSAASFLHPQHIAFTYVDINPETLSVNISHKIYIDDFSLLFFHLYEKEIALEPESDFNPGDIKLINGYMKERFVLSAGNDTLSLNYIKKQQDDQTVWIYFTGKIEESLPDKLEISNMMLMDLYMDQTNLLILNTGSKEQGIMFNWDKRQETIVLKN